MYTFNGNILTVNHKWLVPEGPGPFNPWNLEPGVMRLRFEHDIDPNDYNTQGLWIHVADNVWDWKPNTAGGYQDRLKQIEDDFVLMGWNTKDVDYSITGEPSFVFRNSRLTSIETPLDLSEQIYGYDMFGNCDKLNDLEFIVRLPPNSDQMFRECTNLITVPEFDLNYMPNSIRYMFAGCRALMYGIYDFYTDFMSVQYHDQCFQNAGQNPIGYQDIARLPNDWK